MKFNIVHKLVLLCVLAAGSFTISTLHYQQVIFEDKSLSNWMIVIFVLGILTTFMVIYVGARVSYALMQFDLVMAAAKKGDAKARIKLERHDELGLLASDINQLLDERAHADARSKEENAAILELLRGVYKFSQRDLTTRLEVSDDVTAPLANSLNLMADETAKVLSGVVDIAGHVSQATQRVKRQSDIVIDVVSDEQNQVEQTAVQLDDASKTMSEITILAKSCSDSADKAIRATENSLQSVLNTVQGIMGIRTTIRETEKRIKRLGERSQDISGVVSLINSIAERTQILALNASIYAASAGETGRGFVTIADEIQRLAENSREATSNISILVKNIQSETADTVATMNEAISQVVKGTQLAEQAGSAMKETRVNTSNLVDKVQQIAENSDNQTKITYELRDRSELIKKSTQRTNAQLIDQSAQTDLLVRYSDDLLKAVGVFKLPQDQERNDHKVTDL